MSLILRLEMQVVKIGFVPPHVLEFDITRPLDDLNRLASKRYTVKCSVDIHRGDLLWSLGFLDRSCTREGCSLILPITLQSTYRSFTLPCTIGSLNFYAMADLGASVNVIPKSIFEHLKLARLKNTDMLVEMADMTKRAPIGIVENVLVKIDKFLFPSDFVVIDMLNTRNETTIIGIPFLATIHAEIDVFNKEISLVIGDDRVTFDMDRFIHNFTTPVGNVYMINSIHNDEPSSSSNAQTAKSSRFEKSDNLHNYANYMQEQSSKKTRILKSKVAKIVNR
ncbi:reverse transcriptase domain-containing protein [Tanacetum coccineum]